MTCRMGPGGADMSTTIDGGCSRVWRDHKRDGMSFEEISVAQPRSQNRGYYISQDKE